VKTSTIRIGLLVGSLCAISLSLPPAFAEATAADIVSKIDAAHILDPGSSIRARLDGDRVFVSAYRNPSENDNDVKINAVLIAKAVFEATGDSVSRLTVYFFGQDGSNYSEVSVTAGDVKAFGSGATSQDQLLKSIAIERKRQATDTDRITSQLQNTAYLRPDYRVDLKSANDLVVTSILGDWVPDQDAKLEAVKIANVAAQAAPATVQQIKVSFQDPRGTANRRELNFRKDEVQSIWQQIQSALNGVGLAKVVAPLDIQQMRARSGPFQQERQLLIDRIKQLDKKGIGMTPFVKAFLALEQSAAANDELALKTTITNLSDSLDNQDKAYKAAKEAKFSKGDPGGEPSGGGKGNFTSRTIDFVLEDHTWSRTYPSGTVAANPDGILAEVVARYGSQDKAERSKPFNAFVRDVMRVLNEDGNAGAANRIAQKYRVH
jgi:hypothetical protein